MAQNRKDNYQDNEFVEKNEPFKNDLLGRKDIAQLWQDTLLKSGKHFVMAVDASWGMGKSYFARNWECKLLNDDYKVCYIDAFEYDFTDDPFMTITSNLIEAFEFKDLDEVANKLNVFIRTFKNQTLENMPLLVEGGMQVLINQAAPVLNTSIVNSILKCLKGITKIFTKSIQESSKTTMNPMDKVVDKDKNYSQVLLEFKNLLKEKTAELVEQTRQATVGEIIENNSNTIKQDTKPLIVIVDELDRCKPTYAIEFLEKLKHLFDIDNMIFILFINEKELASAISHTYGVNGSSYIGKFINIYANINFKSYETYSIKDYISKYIYSHEQFVDKNYNYFDEMLFIFNTMHTVYPELSLRDVDNIVRNAKMIDLNDVFHLGMFYILKVIQLKDKKLYEALHNLSTLYIQYDIVMPDLLKSIYDLQHKYGIIVGCFILLCYNIGKSKESFQDLKTIQRTNYNLEKLLQHYGHQYTGTFSYVEYLGQLISLADLNINNTGDI